jgi:hypothetical protein
VGADRLPNTLLRDFNNPVSSSFFGRLQIDREASLDRLVEVVQEIFERVPLGGAAGDGRNFSPISPVLRLMDYDFDLHRGSFNMKMSIQMKR